jgi:serine protease AprX
VRQALKEGNDLPVIVRFTDDAALQRGKKLKSGRAELKRTHKSLRALSVKANRRALREYLATPGVAGISYDGPVAGGQLDALLLPPPPPSPVDASGVRAARSRYGVDGSGVAVAVIDSGVQPHADLPVWRIRAFVDFVNGQTSAYDDYGHGTHVAGIIAGDGAQSGGQYTGAAPGADIVALKVLDATGGGQTSNVLAALEWVLANHAQYNIRVVNLSLGHPIWEPAATDPMVALVDQLTERGIVVVVAAGNVGKNRTTGELLYGGILSPGNAQSAITVGAAHTNGTLARGDDFVADFSSKGPTRYDRFAKPDLVAPGVAVVATAAQGSTLLTRYPTLEVLPGYMRLNGTSMAAPVVAGTAALMLSADSGLTSHTVKAVLQHTAQRLPGLNLVTQGVGEMNAAGAVRLARLIYPTAPLNSTWVKAWKAPHPADHLFGEAVRWTRSVTWGSQVHASNPYAHLAQWDDNVVWGLDADNVVWGLDLDNIVWGIADNIVWAEDDNIVWGITDENVVWGLDDNIVWGIAEAVDNVVWGLMDDNIVWGLSDDNLVWGMDEDNVVWGLSSDSVLGMSVLTGEVR